MLFRKNVAKFCAYCIHAGQAGEDQMLCSKKGFVSSSSVHVQALKYKSMTKGRFFCQLFEGWTGKQSLFR